MDWKEVCEHPDLQNLPFKNRGWSKTFPGKFKFLKGRN